MRKSPTIAMFACLFLSACEEPRQRELPAETDAPAGVSYEAPPEVAPAPTSESAVAEVPAEGAAAPVAGGEVGALDGEVLAPPELPAFSIALEGDRILLSGALRSRLQVDRIHEDLAREFPDRTVEGGLVVEYHRDPVGWPNRISGIFLVDYLHRIESPRIRYEEGVVTLEGTAPDAKTLRELSEMAVEVFADGLTEDMKNLLEVGAGGASDKKGKGGARAVPDGPGLDGPGLDGPGLDGPGLDGPGLDGPGLDGPVADAPEF